MRMKFNKSSQLVLVSAASLLVAGLVTACGTLTVDFVFVASSKAAGSNNYGEMNVYEIDSESGHMRQIPTSPFPSGGRNPIAEAVSSDSAELYVVNQDDSSIVEFAIGNDGKLYPQNTYNTTGNYSTTGAVDPSGIFPLAVAVNGTNLFVANTYQPLPSCSSADPCSGSVGVYPILTAAQAKALTPPETPNALGSPVTNPSTGANYWPLTLSGANSADVIVPTGINVLKSGSYVYVSAYDTTANTGYVFGFAVNSGVLTAVIGSPFAAGIHPSAVASDSTGSYVYVADQTGDEVLGYSVNSGALVQLSGSPFAAGNQPSAITADPASGYVYVANAQDGTVNAYSIGATGALTNLGTYVTGLDPVAIGIDPSKNHFLYTANYLGNNVSGFELETGGTLINSMNSPYTANAQPTAVAAITHK
jgi:6-phosphogluconolactonase